MEESMVVCDVIACRWWALLACRTSGGCRWRAAKQEPAAFSQLSLRLDAAFNAMRSSSHGGSARSFLQCNVSLACPKLQFSLMEGRSQHPFLWAAVLRPNAELELTDRFGVDLRVTLASLELAAA